MLVLAVIIVGLPPVLFLLLKTNASLAVLTIAAGVVLASALKGDIDTLARSAVVNQPNLANNVLTAVLILLPVIIVSFRTKHSGKFALQLIPALCSGVVLWYALVPLLDQVTGNALSATTVYRAIRPYARAIAIGGVAMSIFVTLVISAGGEHHGKKGKHHAA